LLSGLPKKIWLPLGGGKKGKRWGEGGRNYLNIVCTYEQKKLKNIFLRYEITKQRKKQTKDMVTKECGVLVNGTSETK
jgi:hypothetical protein